MKRIFIASLFLFFLSASGCRPAPSPFPASGNLTVHFIDVGQGDCILIDLGQTEVLIDGGERNTGAADYIRPYIDGPLDAIVATHSHADHIGGLIDVLGAYKVTDVFVNGENATTATFKSFISAVAVDGAVVHQVEIGNIIHVGNLTFTVFNPGHTLVPDDPNNNSIVLNLKYGSVDFLFTGDAENSTETKIMLQSEVQPPDVDILKVGHHGSRTASSEAFLEMINPEVAVYSAGVNNPYGHPHRQTIIALNNAGAKVYGTDVHGTVVITTDGTGYTVKTEKQAPVITVN